MLNYAKAGAIAAAVVALFAAGWHVRSLKADADEARTLRSHVLAIQTLAANNNRIAAKYEASRTARQAQARATNKEVQRVTASPFYAPGTPACLDDDGLRQLRAAIAGAPPAAGRPAGPVPVAEQP